MKPLQSWLLESALLTEIESLARKAFMSVLKCFPKLASIEKNSESVRAFVTLKYAPQKIT